jgi:TP901 family phage tail tape measure protein
MPENEIQAVIQPKLDSAAMQGEARKAGQIWSSQKFALGALETSKFTQPLGRIKGQLGEFEKSLEASNARVVAFGASAGAIFAISAALKETVRSAIDVEKRLTQIATVMGRSVSSMSSFGDQLFSIANEMGQTFDTAAKGALELSRQGLGAEDTIKRLSAAMLLARQSGLTVEDSVTAVTAAINSFSNEAIDAIKLVNQLAAVDQKFAVNSSDLAEALKRVGSTANDAGVSMEQLIALVTAAQQTTQRGGAVIGNAFKSIFTRLDRPKVLEQLEGVGVAVKNLDGSVRPVISVLSSLASRFDDLSQSQQAHVAELVGGVYQINVLKASLRDLSKDYSVYTRALDTANGATDEAIRRNEELNKTLSAQIGRNVNNFTKGAANVGNLVFAPAIKKILNSLESASDLDIGKSIGAAILSGIGKALSGPGIAAATLIFLNLGKKLVSFVGDAVRQVSGLNNSLKNQEEIERNILNFLSKEKELFKDIQAGTITQATIHERLISYLKEQTSLLEKQRNVAKELAQTLDYAGYKGGHSQFPLGIEAPKRTKASGNIPEMMERYGALSGGYKPGTVKQMMLEGKPTLYNSAEKVVPYGNSAFIIPPKGSKARHNYDDALRQKGIDPTVFASMGYMPNLASATRDEVLAKYKREAEYGRQPTNYSLRDAVRKGLISDEEAIAFNSAFKPEGAVAFNQRQKSEREASFTNVAGQGLADMFVYEGEPQQSSYAFDKQKVRVSFNVAPLDKGQLKAPVDLVGDVTNFLQDSVFKFANKIGAPIIGPSAKPFLDTAVAESQGNIGGLVGSIFEHGMLTAFQGSIKRSGSVGTSNFDVSNVTPELKKLFPTAISPMADFKARVGIAGIDDSDTRKNMAYKILIHKGHAAGLRSEHGGAPSGASVLESVSAKKGFASGYIANLSPVKNAIQREMAAGYRRDQVRVGFDPRVGPLVYNTTEGSASKAVELHRRMGKTISEIKHAGAASGRIPNLAEDDTATGDIGLGIGIFASQLAFGRTGSGLHSKKIAENDAKLIRIQEELNSSEMEVAKDTEKIAKLRAQEVTLNASNVQLGKLREQDEKRRSKLLAGAFIVPAIGGIIESSLSAFPRIAKSAGGLSEAISNGAQIAFAIPGYLGLVIGGLTAAATGIGKIYHAISDKAPDLEKSLAKERDAFERASNATSNFAQAFDKLNDAYQNQTTSAETISQLQKDYAQALADVPDEYKTLVASAGSAADAQKAVSLALQKQATKISQLELSTSLAHRLDSSRGVFFDTSVLNSKSETGRRDIKSLAARTISTADNPQAFASRIAGANIGSAGDFKTLVNSARNAKEIGDELADTLTRFSNEANGLQGIFDNSSESLNHFVKAIQDTAIATRNAVANFELTQGIRKAQLALDARLKSSGEDAQKSVESLNDAIKALAGQGIAFANTRANLGNQKPS